jgi:AraC-like DNA-binding protein
LPVPVAQHGRRGLATSSTSAAMTPSTLDVQRVVVALEVMISKVDRAEPFALAVDAADIGRRQLERNFRNLRTTPYRELCRIRLELAVGELTSRQGSSSHLRGISNRVGYRDERRLREATQDAFGLSPGEIRRGARIERDLKLDETVRAQWRGKRARVGLWSSAYRRRQSRETLQHLLGKAKPQGSKVILGHITFPRPSKAREEAGEIARTRALELYADARGRLRSAAA